MKTLAELEEKFNEHDLGKLFDYLKKYARNSIKVELNPTTDDEIEIGKSKMGGKPDLPKSIQWFQNKTTNKPMSFIAQLNFADVKPFDTDNKLPEKGILYLFYDLEEMPWGYDPKDAVGKEVFYFDGDIADLERRETPDNIEEENVFMPASLIFKNEMEIPDAWSSICDFELSDEEYDRYWEIKEEFDGIHNKVLGHSNVIQNGMELESELVTNGLYCGNASGYEDPKRKELEKNIGNWNLLLQIDSNEEIDMMWGDSGRIYLWINDENLKNKKFENSWLILQCY